MGHGKWTEQFGISAETVAAWKPHGQAAVEPLFWGLANGKLPESEYYAWAQTTFELPLVTDEYFAIPADQMFWDRVRSLHAWKPDLLPLAEWEGVLLIACVEPPTNFSYSQPHRFVLASARQLQLLWSHLNPAAIHAPPNATDAPEGIRPETVVGSGVVDMAADLPDGVLVNFASAAPSADTQTATRHIPGQPAADFSMPDGFAQSFSTEPAQSNAMPDGFAFPEGLAPKTSEAPQGIAIDFDLEAKTEKLPGPLVTEQTEPAAVVPQTPPPTPPPTPVTPPIVSEQSDMPFEPSISFSSQTMTDINWVQTIETFNVEKCSNVDELATHTLSAMTRHFNGALLFRLEGDLIKPWKYTQPFRTPSKDYGGLELSSPNIFRIVDRTRLPYHGPVLPAPENDRFFKSFLGGKSPAHVTIVPIIHKKKLIGMAMGIADDDKPYKHILPIMEGLATQFATTFARLAPEAVAA